MVYEIIKRVRIRRTTFNSDIVASWNIIIDFLAVAFNHGNGIDKRIVLVNPQTEKWIDESSEEVFAEFKKWFENYRGECRFYLYSSYGQFGYLCFLKETFCYKDKEFIVGFFEFTNCNGNAYEENADFFMDMVDMLDETPQRLLDAFDDIQELNYSVRKIIRKRIEAAEMDD